MACAPWVSDWGDSVRFPTSEGEVQHHCCSKPLNCPHTRASARTRVCSHPSRPVPDPVPESPAGRSVTLSHLTHPPFAGRVRMKAGGACQARVWSGRPLPR